MNGNEEMEESQGQLILRGLLDTALPSMRVVHQYQLKYFNMVFQVIHVVRSRKGACIIRAWDGFDHSLHTCKSFFFLSDDDVAERFSDPNDFLESVPDSYYVDIVVYGEYVPIAMELKARDIICLGNLHFALTPSGSSTFTLHNGGQTYHRGIYHLNPSTQHYEEIEGRCSRAAEHFHNKDHGVPPQSSRTLPDSFDDSFLNDGIRKDNEDVRRDVATINGVIENIIISTGNVNVAPNVCSVSKAPSPQVCCVAESNRALNHNEQSFLTTSTSNMNRDNKSSDTVSKPTNSPKVFARTLKTKDAGIISEILEKEPITMPRNNSNKNSSRSHIYPVLKILSHEKELAFEEMLDDKPLAIFFSNLPKDHWALQSMNGLLESSATSEHSQNELIVNEKRVEDDQPNSHEDDPIQDPDNVDSVQILNNRKRANKNSPTLTNTKDSPKKICLEKTPVIQLSRKKLAVRNELSRLQEDIDQNKNLNTFPTFSELDKRGYNLRHRETHSPHSLTAAVKPSRKRNSNVKP